MTNFVHRPGANIPKKPIVGRSVVANAWLLERMGQKLERCTLVRERKMNKQSQPDAELDNNVVASLVVTLDGYVAWCDGGVNFLEKYLLTDFILGSWTMRIGALAMGRTTYEQSLQLGWVWGAPFRRSFSPTSRTWRYQTASTLRSSQLVPQMRLLSG